MQTDKFPPFGLLLAKYRKDADLKQVELAGQVGLDARTISAYERGRRQPPRPDRLTLFFEALALAPEDRRLLRDAAARDRRVWGKTHNPVSPLDERIEGTEPSREEQPPCQLMPRGKTPEAQNALARFERWRQSRLKRVMQTSLSIVVWCPTPEKDGPIAEKRKEIQRELHSLGHTLASYPPSAAHQPADISGEPGEDSNDLGAVELFLLVAEDDPTVIEQAVSVCENVDILPNVRAMIPRRYEFMIADELDELINLFQGVYWYEDNDVAASHLVKEARRYSEARRKAKAFKSFKEEA